MTQSATACVDANFGTDHLISLGHTKILVGVIERESKSNELGYRESHFARIYYIVRVRALYSHMPDGSPDGGKVASALIVIV